MRPDLVVVVGLPMFIGCWLLSQWSPCLVILQPVETTSPPVWTLKDCVEGQDECQNVTVTSELDGLAVAGSLLQCGTEPGRATLCGTYKSLAITLGYAIDECEVDVCENCSAAHVYTLSSLLLLLIAAYNVVWSKGCWDPVEPVRRPPKRIGQGGHWTGCQAANWRTFVNGNGILDDYDTLVWSTHSVWLDENTFCTLLLYLLAE